MGNTVSGVQFGLNHMSVLLSCYYRIYSRKVSVPFLESELLHNRCEDYTCGANCCAIISDSFSKALEGLQIDENNKNQFFGIAKGKCVKERLPWTRENRLNAIEFQTDFENPWIELELRKMMIICLFTLNYRKVWGNWLQIFDKLVTILKDIASGDRTSPNAVLAISHLRGDLQQVASGNEWLVLLDQAWLLYEEDRRAYNLRANLFKELLVPAAEEYNKVDSFIVDGLDD